MLSVLSRTDLIHLGSEVGETVNHHLRYSGALSGYQSQVNQLNQAKYGAAQRPGSGRIKE